mmetsp:Transcript_18820/g.20968  ORF Transcript_18820/g.20968 Transcript_18820/m.20968 type:complete len:321 (-) Transcript_18820:232-1194(-)|eukprot:CAMPEP_0194144906 /NCGR_PEP_ID=MMETSP0152-20130528/13883_1 /TAXON_ID=1049557 /ORGANISM="Thalassiothrix antarctica, Strain L6-D1" /LENGTH=320 /DNA_ID=CAMNT_0038844923 /DNA_START=83 /DNA_END=1045 /DNA_ORIENTATION=-
MKVLAILIASISASQGFMSHSQNHESGIIRRYVVAETEAAISVASAAIPTTLMIAGFAASMIKAEEDAKLNGSIDGETFLSKLLSQKKKMSTGPVDSKEATRSVATFEPMKPKLNEKLDDGKSNVPSFLSKFFPSKVSSKKTKIEEVTESDVSVVHEATESTSKIESVSLNSDQVSQKSSKHNIETPSKEADETSESLSQPIMERTAELSVEEKSKLLLDVSPKTTPKIPSEEVSVIDFSELKSEVASTMEKENEKMERLQKSIEEDVVELVESTVTEPTEKLERVDKDLTNTKKGGFFRSTFRVLKKLIAPWRKWKNIS